MKDQDIMQKKPVCVYISSLSEVIKHYLRIRKWYSLQEALNNLKHKALKRMSI